jgi:hypothetical protein
MRSSRGCHGRFLSPRTPPSASIARLPEPDPVPLRRNAKADAEVDRPVPVRALVSADGGRQRLLPVPTGRRYRHPRPRVLWVSGHVEPRVGRSEQRHRGRLARAAANGPNERKHRGTAERFYDRGEGSCRDRSRWRWPSGRRRGTQARAAARGARAPDPSAQRSPRGTGRASPGQDGRCVPSSPAAAGTGTRSGSPRLADGRCSGERRSPFDRERSRVSVARLATKKVAGWRMGRATTVVVSALVAAGRRRLRGPGSQRSRSPRRVRRVRGAARPRCGPSDEEAEDRPEMRVALPLLETVEEWVKFGLVLRRRVAALEKPGPELATDRPSVVLADPREVRA